MRTKPIDTEPFRDELEELVPARSRAWWWVAAVTIVILAAAYVWAPSARKAVLNRRASPSPETAATPPGPQLGFSARHANGDWRLSWSREIVAKADPVGAILTIHDGGAERTQFLSPRDLASGFLLYVAKTSDLVFDLKVTSPTMGDLEDQIRVIGADQVANAPPPYAAPPPAPAPAEIEKRAPAPEVAAPKPDFVAPKPEARPRSAAKTRRLEPPVRTQAPAAPAAAPAAASAKQPGRVDAAPLRTFVGIWPHGVPRRGPVTVQVRVHIDAKGRVGGAFPMDRNASNSEFLNSAVTAARLWTFAPATENGAPVPSESVLSFEFIP